jgi:organic hydroperoxide reductase OsmC/OhrA
MKDPINKLIELTGTSTASIEDAVDKAIKHAHETCPYSKALRGDTSVKLTVD